MFSSTLHPAPTSTDSLLSTKMKENEEIDTDTILLTELQALLQGC